MIDEGGGDTCALVNSSSLCLCEQLVGTHTHIYTHINTDLRNLKIARKTLTIKPKTIPLSSLTSHFEKITVGHFSNSLPKFLSLTLDLYLLFLWVSPRNSRNPSYDVWVNAPGTLNHQ